MNSFKKKLLLISFIFLGNFSYADENLKPVEIKTSLCDQIGALQISTLPRLADPSMGDSIQDPYAFYNFLTETIAHPQAHDKRKRAFKILAAAEQAKNKHDKKDTWHSKTVLDQNVWSDLNILAGSKVSPTTCLVEILSEKKTRTEIGKAFLAGMLARPTDDYTLLEGRQRIVKKLVEDETLFASLDQLLQETAQAETLFTGLWDTELLMQFLQQGYSKMEGVGPWINRSPLCLEITNSFRFLFEGTGIAIKTITPVVLTLYGLALLRRGEPVLTEWAQYCFGETGFLLKIFPALKNRWTEGFIALGVGVAAALSLKSNFQGMHTNFLFDDFLRRRLVFIASYVQTARAISEKFDNCFVGENSAMTFFGNVRAFFVDTLQQDPELAQLDDLLQANTFSKDSGENFSLFFSRGNVLAAFYLLENVKARFTSLMAGIGELDAFMTIAKIMKESKKQQAQFCFPTYLDCHPEPCPDLSTCSGLKAGRRVDSGSNSCTPAIMLEEAWNPFLDPSKVVTNNVQLGRACGCAHMVVTGPNSAGKSTILKSVALAIILAQSLGIAPAKSMSLTPFSYLVTYMNVADSIVDQESRFQAEARRVFEYGSRLEDLAHKGQFSFALFDEIFSGTSPAEGALLGYKVAKILGNYPHCINIIATHFEKLIDLEKDTQGNFVNFNVAVEQDSSGAICFDEHHKIKRLFKLNRGASQQHIARAVFEEKNAGSQTRFFRECFAE